MRLGRIGRIRAWPLALRRDALTLWYALGDRRTPPLAKIVAGLLVAYAFSPVDLIPDFIPVLGLIDEAILLPLGIWLVLRLVPTAVIEDCRTRTDHHLTAGLALVLGLWIAAIIGLGWLVLD